MKTIILFIALSFPCFGSWAKIYTVQVDRTKCGASNLTNFDVLIFASDTSLKDVAHGGSVTNSSGFDIVVAVDGTLATYIPWEVEFWDNVNGIIWLWANVATVNGSGSGINSSFAVAWGNSAITTQQNTGSFSVANVWSNNFTSVYHLQQASSPYIESSNGLSGSGGNSPSQATGQIFDAQRFVFASSNYFIGAHAVITGNAGTFSAWVKIGTLQASTMQVEDDFDNPLGQGCIIYINTSGTPDFFCDGVAAHPTGPTSIADSQWHYLVGVMNLTGGINNLYVDGSLATSVAPTGFGNFWASGTAMGVGAHCPSGCASPTNFLDGWIDEARTAHGARTSDWILSEYNNQAHPGNIGSPNFLIWNPYSVTTLGYPAVY